jgi:hypothetical protein
LRGATNSCSLLRKLIQLPQTGTRSLRYAEQDAAAGARYDGNPEVGFIDIGTLGAWGEGHTVPSTRRPYAAPTAIRQIDLYHRYFPHSLVVVNDDFSIQGRGIEQFGYARELGMTSRDDSILVEKPAIANRWAARRPRPTVTRSA